MGKILASCVEIMAAAWCELGVDVIESMSPGCFPFEGHITKLFFAGVGVFICL